jgi:hypothetical protein
VPIQLLYSCCRPVLDRMGMHQRQEPMSRVLVLIVALILVRTLLVRKRCRSLTATSPYMNSLDGAISAQQLSLAMEELDRIRSSSTRFRFLR